LLQDCVVGEQQLLGDVVATLSDRLVYRLPDLIGKATLDPAAF
jgi:hypothetical protein